MAQTLPDTLNYTSDTVHWGAGDTENVHRMIKSKSAEQNMDEFNLTPHRKRRRHKCFRFLVGFSRRPISLLLLLIVMSAVASITIVTSVDRTIWMPESENFFQSGHVNSRNIRDVKENPAPSTKTTPKTTTTTTRKPLTTTKPGSTKKVQFLDDNWEEKLKAIDDNDEKKAAEAAGIVKTPGPGPRFELIMVTDAPTQKIKVEEPKTTKTTTTTTTTTATTTTTPTTTTTTTTTTTPSTSTTVFPTLPGTSSQKNIPRRFHFIWRSLNVPRSVTNLMRSWQEHHLDWEVWFWRTEDVHRLVDEKFTNYKALFDLYPESKFKTAMLKYFVLHAYGGVYISLDMENIRNIGDIIAGHTCVLTREPQEMSVFLRKSQSALLNTKVMAACAGHPFMEAILKSLPAALRHSASLLPTPIDFLNDNFNEYDKYLHTTDEERVTVLENKFFMPYYERKLTPTMKSKCANSQAQLSGPAQIICEKLNRPPNLLTRKKSPGPAYATCHWLRLWSQKSSSDNTHIKDILPKVRIFSQVTETT